jgi:transcription elongation factor GreA-like protein
MDKLKKALADELDKATADLKADLVKQMEKMVEKMKNAGSKKEVIKLLNESTELTSSTFRKVFPAEHPMHG